MLFVTVDPVDLRGGHNELAGDGISQDTGKYNCCIRSNPVIITIDNIHSSKSFGIQMFVHIIQKRASLIRKKCVYIFIYFCRYIS